MIVAAEVPQIPGDMDALAGHARGLGTTGTDLADTGARVHNTWQGLAPHYIAPEAGELLAATGPVQGVAASVGEDVGAIGRALATYAETVRPLQDRLRQLQDQATTFNAGLPGDDSWESDPAVVEQRAGILAGITTAVADWHDAQRVCASAISALYGGPGYRADNGDGVLEPGEFGFTADQLTGLLDAGGALPWGAAVEQDQGLLGDLRTAWHGFAVDGFMADLTGVGALVGLSAQGFSWSTAGEAWGAIGKLTIIPYVDDVLRGEMNPFEAVGTVYGNWGDVLGGVIALDEWAENPMGAIGQTLYNVVTIPLVATKVLKPVASALNRPPGGPPGRVSRLRDKVVEGINGMPTVDEIVRRIGDRLDIHPPRFGPVPAIVGDGPGGQRYDVDTRGPSDRVQTESGAGGIEAPSAATPRPELNVQERSALDERLAELESRRQAEFGTLESDPDHGGAASPKSRDEARVALDLSDRGILPDDIRRPSGPEQGDYYSPSTGTFYDLKGVHSDWPPLSDQVDRSQPFRGAYDSTNNSKLLDNIQDQVDRGRVPIIDLRNANQEAIDSITGEARKRGWNSVIWYP